MIRVAAIIYVLVATVLAGGAVTAMLSLGRITASEISLAALIGALAALPVAWAVAKMINAEVNHNRN